MLESDTRSKRVIAAGRITPGFTCTHHQASIGLNGECLLCGRTPTMWIAPAGGGKYLSGHRIPLHGDGGGCEHQADGWTCNRDHGHPGRHMVLAPTATGSGVALAAWPGTHRPTEADLELPVELPRARAEAFTPMQAVTA